MSDDTEWPNNVRTAAGARSVWMSDPNREALAILSQTKVQSPDPGFELHFLRSANRDEWLTHVEKLERSGAYAWVRLVRVDFHDPDTGERVTLGTGDSCGRPKLNACGRKAYCGGVPPRIHPGHDSRLSADVSGTRANRGSGG
jgi:hypothetical protein